MASHEEEYTLLSRQIVEFLENHQSVDSFDRNLLKLKSNDLTVFKFLDEIMRSKYSKLLSLDERKSFVVEQISRKLATLSMELKRQIFQEVFAGMPVDFAKKLAKNANEDGEKKVTDTDTMLSGEVYGEIEFSSFANIMQRCMALLKSSGYLMTHSSRKLTFVDLGHGTGKALVALGLVFGSKFSEAYGIEYAHGLCAESLNRIVFYSQLIENHPLYKVVMGSAGDTFSNASCKLIGHEGDFFDVPDSNNGVEFDWTTAGRVFFKFSISCKCYILLMICYFYVLQISYSRTQRALTMILLPS